VLIIQDPKKIDTNTIKANDIIIICLECLNEYANYRFDEMKAEIIRSRGSVTLLNLISRDIGDKINELSLWILAALAEHSEARDIIIEDQGLRIAFNIYEKPKNRAIRK